MAFRGKSPRILFAFRLTKPSPPQSSAFFSTDIVGDTPILVRDFIRSALYDPNHGYFSQRPGSVGMLDKSIKFNQLEGRSAYMRHLDKIYKQNGVAWFTRWNFFKLKMVLLSLKEAGKRALQLKMVLLSLKEAGKRAFYEISVPWYAHGIAEAIMRTANLSVPLKIYEIGGGSGTCAKCIMDYMMLNAPAKVYKNMTYTSVEISSSLARKQLETVGQVPSHLSRFRVECRDAAEKSGWGAVDPQPCWVLMLEVLDNLPHDLVYSETQVSPWMEVWLEKQQDSLHISESYKPLQDSLIARCIEVIDTGKDHTTLGSKAISAARNIWSKVRPHPRRAWIPTGCLQLLEVLHWALPGMSLIASDFNYLPDVKISGERAPLVSTKKDGRSADYSSYLDAKGDADIFFPTEFWLLERIDHYCSGWLKQQAESKSFTQVKKRRTIILDTASFMEEFGLPSKTRTKDGYNPLLDDFKNTKFYLSVPTHNKV